MATKGRRRAAISEATTLKLAAEAGLDPRTIARALEGTRPRSAVARRAIVDAVVKLGLENDVSIRWEV